MLEEEPQSGWEQGDHEHLVLLWAHPEKWDTHSGTSYNASSMAAKDAAVTAEIGAPR